MKWAAVEIEHADEVTAAQTGTALMEILSAVMREKTAPPDFEVHHVWLAPAHHVYYLSPRLASAAEGRLGRFAVQYLAGAPNLKGARKVVL